MITGIPINQPATTTGNAAKPPKDNKTSGFMRDKSIKAWTKPNGILRKEVIV
jgi:hypothetical protein